MLKVVELFAGVGGFRLGLEQVSEEFETVWFNQWEPNKKKQWAWECYVSHFGDMPNSNTDINLVNKKEIPNFDLLVGGFPCQSFSVARSADKALGLEDTNKGVLWFQIRDILEEKNPKYVLLENVDRLLKSPAKQRGRDFGIILYQFNQLGYKVEWRVITASNYSNYQRRKRTFIFASKEDFKPFFNEEFSAYFKDNRIIKPFNKLPEDIQHFKFDFGEWGYMANGYFHSEKVIEKSETQKPLKEILEVADLKYYLNEKQIEKFKYLKGSKKIPRVTKEGHAWTYSEGAMTFPEDLNKPSRTMLTSEGGVNRCSHVVDDNGLRFLTPIECERLNGFPDGWTENMPNRMRYFCMGNALVVPLISRIGKHILEIDKCQSLV